MSVAGKRADRVIKSFDLTSALPSGATFTRASIGTRITATGALASETANVPCFDYAPITLAPQGIFLRQSTKNCVLQSNRVDNAAWSKTGWSAVSPIAGPDGVVAAYKLQESATTSSRYMSQSCTMLSSETVVTIQAIVKPAGRRWIQLYAYTPTHSAYFQNFDLTNIALGQNFQVIGSSFSFVTAAIRALNDGWIECSVTINRSVSTTVECGLGLGTADTNINTPSYAGDGTSGVYVAHLGLYRGNQIAIVPTTSAPVTTADEALSLPISDGVWDIVTTDTTGSTTARRSVVNGYTVSPRSGRIRVTSIRATQVASYAGFDSDAITYLHSNQIVHLSGRKSVDATFKALKADGTLTFSDIAFAGFAPGRNLDSGTTVRLAGGWTAATAVAGTLSSESRMRNGNAFGLWTNNGSSDTLPTRIVFPSLPLSADYGVILVCRPYGNPAGGRALYGIGNNSIAIQQLGSQHFTLGSDVDTTFTRGLAPSRSSAVGHIQDANAGSPRGIALGEYGYDRTVSGVNVYGSLDAYIGSKWITSSASNTTVGGNPEVILEAVCFFKNPTKTKWRRIASIIEANLVVPETRTIQEFILTGQSNASRDAALAFDLIVGADADYRGRYMVQNYTNINQPLSQWVGASAPYARTGYYNSDILPGTGSWAVLTNTYEPNGVPAGIIWMQGEADAGFSQGGTNADKNAVAADYPNKLAAFISFVRTDYPNIPIVILQTDWTTATGDEVTRLATIRSTQAAVVAANTRMALVDTRGMTRNADGVHLEGQGLVDAMTAAWSALKALV